MSVPAVRVHRARPPVLDRVRVVLVAPSHPANIGACARAIRVMGINRLVLVAPRLADAARHRDALALASGAGEVLERIEVFETLAQALADCTLAVAVSAEAREFGPPQLEPEATALRIVAELQASEQCQAAMVFGPERTGLSVGDAQLCQLLCSIPGEPDYNSLNLSHAVQVIAYVLRRQALANPLTDPLTDASAGPLAAENDYATVQEIEAFFDHLQRALRAIRYLDPAHPKKLLPRLRRLFARTRLESEEVDLLRGVCKMMEQSGNIASSRGSK